MSPPQPAWLYILRLRSGALDVGITRDPSRRWREHIEAHGSGRTTSEDPPRQVVYRERHPSVTQAIRREKQLKRWSRAKKEALVAGDWQVLKRLSKPKTNRETIKDRKTNR